eukprot:TRINITY_DN4920_c0_g1_i1.p1 TRINITY_DN4920_c0_g1~~TRINITY_DN4920_c0_g1_i1.p1  ORF type:complete len:428 (+),score=108.59 TRINITY_DN4920_c0_g1_i1:204-1487(+)
MLMEEANKLNFKNAASDDVDKPVRSRKAKDAGWKAPKLVSTQTNRVDDESFVGDLEKALNGNPEKNAWILITDQEGNVIRCKNSAHLNDILRTYKFDEFKKETEDEKSPAEQSIIWIDVEGGNTEEINAIGKRFDFHPLTIEDCTSSQGRQKLEPFHDYMFLVLQSLHHSHYSWETENYIKICVFPSVVLTFHKYPSYAIQVARNRLVRLYKSRAVNLVDSVDILHTVIDSICDTDDPVVSSIDQEISDLEETIYLMNNREQEAVLLKRIGLTRRQIVRYRQILWPKKEILLNIVEKTYAAEAASAGTSIHVAYYRDIYDHVVTMVQKLEVHSEVIGSLESTYLAKVSISVAQSANDVNDIMKKFSSVGTIILPLSYVTGLFGMNVPIPWQVGVGNFYDTSVFYTIFAAMMIFAVTLTIWFKRNNWL